MAKNNNNHNNDSQESDEYDSKGYERRSYKDAKDELIKLIHDQEEYNKNFREQLKLKIIDMIRILRFAEKKDKKVIKEQIKNDFLQYNVEGLGQTKLAELVEEEFNPNYLIEKRKKRIAVSADGTQTLEEGEGGDGGDGDDSPTDIVSKRKQFMEDQNTKMIKKGSAQLPKIKPTVSGAEALEDEEEEEEVFEEESTDVTNNIVIEDEEHLIEIGKLIQQQKAVVIIVDQHLQVIGIQAGKSLAE
jgi:hypothetical protein